MTAAPPGEEAAASTHGPLGEAGEDAMPRLEGPQTNACQKWACRIQACLKDANYDSRACAWEVNALRECCRKFGKNSTHCTRAWQPEEEGRLA